MEKKKTLKYSSSLLLLFVVLQAYPQKSEWNGVLVGADLSRFIVPITVSTRYGWEVSGEYEFMKDVFGNVEIGTQTTNVKFPNYNYSSDGFYTRLGVDYNYMKHLDEESSDKLLIGLRYGFTTFLHGANNISITDNIWGDYTNGKVDKKLFGAGWMEIATGMRAHLFNNFYLGWSVRFRVKLFQQANNDLVPYHIPGYGRAWSNSRTGFNYSLYYKIPIVKKRKDSPDEKSN